MADTGFNYAGTITEGAGTSAWTNPNNISGSPNAIYAINYARIDLTGVQLIINGTPSGDVPVFQNLPTSVGDITFGSGSTVWGLSLSYTDINNTNFGVILNHPYFKTISATNYGFSISSGATINGVEVVYRGYYTNIRGTITPYIDSVGIKVYYTDGGGGATTKPNYYYAQQ